MDGKHKFLLKKGLVLLIIKGYLMRIMDVWQKLLLHLSRRFERISFLNDGKPKMYALSYYGIYLRDRKNDLTFKYAVNGHYGDYFSDILRDLQGV